GGLPNRATLERKGWNIRARGRLLIGSRYPILNEVALRGSDVTGKLSDSRRFVGLACEIDTPHGVIHVFNFHGSTPRAGLEAILANGRRGLPALQANIATRQAESKVASDWVGRSSTPVIVAGDFNLPVESAVFKQNWSMYLDS